ncbi:sideroflexin-1-3-like isoform X2 [Zophobas morio]|uniref:sideroflexin-1-3-like isoform X2 n=1 Tax=Zophobas morio TaxID=2755281 RepID=UPI0030835631
MPAINIDIEKPRYDQNTFIGRAKHFFLTTNPLNIFATSRQLEDAKSLVTKYRLKHPLPPGTTEDDLWRAKILYDSAFHPDTGEKMFLLGRMSAQVPMNMLITGGLLAFYNTTSGVLFWQWFNQSFNAMVNYTNRSGDATFTGKQVASSYVFATTAAVTTALSLNRLCRNAPPLVGRLTPLAACAAANCVNIPLMRAQELTNGTPVFDAERNRISMAVPGMTLTPVLMDYLEKRGVLKRYPWINLPVQTAFCGVVLIFTTPLACAFFKQKAQIAYRKLEPELKEQLDKKFGDHPPEYVYYNKGL